MNNFTFIPQNQHRGFAAFYFTCKECVLNLSQSLLAGAKFCPSHVEVYYLTSCPQGRTSHGVALKQVKRSAKHGKCK